MKINKILAAAVTALTMTACSNGDYTDYPNFLGGVNSESGVTVTMQPTASAFENEKTFQVPVLISGERNGKVEVTVSVKEVAATASTESAKENVHYIVTSKTINIAADATNGFIEIAPIWERGEINDDRLFEITITDVKGATIGSPATCVVTLINADNPYTSMCGTWKLTGVDRNGKEISYNITVRTPDSSSDKYGTYLYGFGIFGESDYMIPFKNFTFDPVTEQGTMEIAYGEMMTDGLAFNYGDAVGIAFPVALYRTPAGQLAMDGQSVCAFDGSYSELVIPADATVYGGLFSNETGQFTGYGVGQIGQMVMKR